MSKHTEKVILPEHSEAAVPETVNAWRSRDGFLFESEESARWSGATHVRCSGCGEVVRKSQTLCVLCRNARRKAAHEARPRQKWDGKALIYSETQGLYYPDPASALDTLEEGETAEDLHLIVCVPLSPHRLDVSDFADELPEDGGTPYELEVAIDAFNESVKHLVLSWVPGRFALDLDDQDARGEVTA